MRKIYLSKLHDYVQNIRSSM